MSESSSCLRSDTNAVGMTAITAVAVDSLLRSKRQYLLKSCCTEMYEPVNYGVLVKRLRQLPFTEQTASSILLYLTISALEQPDF